MNEVHPNVTKATGWWSSKAPCLQGGALTFCAHGKRTPCISSFFLQPSAATRLIRPACKCPRTGGCSRSTTGTRTALSKMSPTASARCAAVAHRQGALMRQQGAFLSPVDGGRRVVVGGLDFNTQIAPYIESSGHLLTPASARGLGHRALRATSTPRPTLRSRSHRATSTPVSTRGSSHRARSTPRSTPRYTSTLLQFTFFSSLLCSACHSWPSLPPHHHVPPPCAAQGRGGGMELGR